VKVPNLSEMEKTMPNLKNSCNQPRNLLSTVDHAAFQSSIDTYWRVAPDGMPTAQGVLWLFCWAKTGQNSERTAQHVRALFDGILDISFESFDEKVDHDWAREMRYADGDIEADLEGLLR
jgi:hypothetical protein